jgi:predicted P-loop ATPase
LPVNVISINHKKYNEINKAALFMAFYDLYKSGFEWHLSNEDIIQLNEGTDDFQATNMEAELILSFLAVPDTNALHEGVLMTNTEIKNYLETWSKQKIFSTNKLGKL